MMLSNPVVAVVLSEKQKYVPVAPIKKKSGPRFSGVITAKKGSGINVSADLKGKTFER